MLVLTRNLWTDGCWTGSDYNSSLSTPCSGKLKMPFTSIFSFSHNVFNRLLFRVVKSRNCVVKGKIGLSKGRKLQGKGENTGYHHFLLFAQCFKKFLFIYFFFLGGGEWGGVSLKARFVSKSVHHGTSITCVILTETILKSKYNFVFC